MRRTSQKGILGNVTYLIDGFDIREPGNVVNNISLVNRSCFSKSLLSAGNWMWSYMYQYVIHCRPMKYINGFGPYLRVKVSRTFNLLIVNLDSSCFSQGWDFKKNNTWTKLKEKPQAVINILVTFITDRGYISLIYKEFSSLGAKDNTNTWKQNGQKM